MKSNQPLVFVSKDDSPKINKSGPAYSDSWVRQFPQRQCSTSWKDTDAAHPVRDVYHGSNPFWVGLPTLVCKAVISGPVAQSRTG